MKKEKSYKECEDCGGLLLEDNSRWLGEDEHERGRSKQFYRCEDCDKIVFEISFE
jgi:uncharacterized protein with PIN domain